MSAGDNAPDDVSMFHGMTGKLFSISNGNPFNKNVDLNSLAAGDLNAPYLHEILSDPLVKENHARGLGFNLRGCGDSIATSPTLHNGGCTSELGTVVTWAKIKWPKSKIYDIGTLQLRFQ